MAARLVPEPEGEQPRLVSPFIPAQVPPALGEETRSLLSDEALRSIYSRVWRYLRSRGVSVADAEEVTQESVFAAWRRRPPLESASATAYALTTARNKYVDLIRVRHRRPELLTDFTDWDRPSDEDRSQPCDAGQSARGHVATVDPAFEGFEAVSRVKTVGIPVVPLVGKHARRSVQLRHQ